MSKVNLIEIALMLFLTGCAPAASPIQLPASTVIAENPPACAGAKMVYHSQLREMLLIGCAQDSDREDHPNIIWAWNGARWHKITEGGPLMRVLGSAAYDQKRNVLVLYGGQSLKTGQCVRETWEWDGQVWVRKEAESPPVCDHFEMVYDESRAEVVLFGGQDKSQNPNNETWSWNGATWTSISNTGPESRAHFGFEYDPTHEQILLYGGYTGSVLDDFWAWKNNAWQEINFPGPGVLSHFGMTIVANTNALIIFGGATSSSTFSSLSDKTWILTGGAWSELNLENSPSKRGSPAMDYDPERKKTVLYGGFDSNGDALNDIWEWDGKQWSCVVNCQ